MAGLIRGTKFTNAPAFRDTCKGGAPLPNALRRYAEQVVGTDLEDVRISASSHIETLDLSAVAVGDRIVVHPSIWRGFDDERSLHLLLHELTHVAQQRAGRVPFHRASIVFDAVLEGEAELTADAAVHDLARSSAEPRCPRALLPPVPGWFEGIALQPHPGSPVIRRALSWLAKRSAKAFPADKLLTILGTIAAAEILTEGIADAAEKVATEAERLERFKEMERNKIDLWDFVPGIGNIWGGSLNQFEDLELAYDRYVDKVVRDVIIQTERQAGCSFANRAEIEEIVRCGMGISVLLENPG